MYFVNQKGGLIALDSLTCIAEVQKLGSGGFASLILPILSGLSRVFWAERHTANVQKEPTDHYRLLQTSNLSSNLIEEQSGCRSDLLHRRLARWKRIYEGIKHEGYNFSHAGFCGDMWCQIFLTGPSKTMRVLKCLIRPFQ